MVKEMSGSLLNIAPKGALICIPVNTVGIAGKGMAKYMKLRWPDAHEHYVRECKRGRISNGELKTYVEDDFHVAFFPTKIHWSNPSLTSLIQSSLTRLHEFMVGNQIDECWMPAVGCGKDTGQLDFYRDIKPLVTGEFEESTKRIFLFKPVEF